MEKDHLDYLFKPESVAVIGASEKADSPGWSLLHNLQQGGFPGQVFPINPKIQEILGLPAYPAVTEVPGTIDLAVIAIPIADIPPVLRQCGQVGVKTAVIISVGGKEVGAEGDRIEAEIQAAAEEAGIRYLGHSSLGLICPWVGLHASLARQAVHPGHLAFISQSGALCSSVLGWAARKNIGFSHFISVGSKTDLDFADLIDYLGNQEPARSIIIYMESLTRHRKFMSAARSVSRIKPIIVIKAGRQQTKTRTGEHRNDPLISEDTAYEAFFRRAGIVRVDTIGQLFDCAETLGKIQRPLGGEIAIITNGGGPALMAVDALRRWNKAPGELSPEIQVKLANVLPAVWKPGNPINILRDATPERYAQTVHTVMEKREFSGLVIILSPQTLTNPTEVAATLVRETENQNLPIFAVWMGGDEVAPGIKILNQAGIPTFKTPEAAVDTFMEMYSYSRHLVLLQETPSRQPTDLKVNTKQARAFLNQCLAPAPKHLTELEAKAILSTYGIPVNRTVAAASAAEAKMAAQEIGFPVLLKINAPELEALTERTRVIYHLNDDLQVERAFDRLTGETRNRHPQLRNLGVTVQAQERKPHFELFIGCRQDPHFGPLLGFGTGGPFVEIFRDIAVDLPPLNLLLARRLMERTRIFQALAGESQLPAADLDQLAEILVRVSQLATDFPEIGFLEINPLFIINGRATAVAARLIVEASELPAPRHLIIAPYPNQYENDWMLRDGTPVLLRPMKPEDEPLVSAFLMKCSSETIFFRYFKKVKQWTHEMLIRFTQNDYDREVGLMALGQPPGPEVMMGVGRLIMAADRSSAEFAVIVADPWQGKGLGPKLVEQVIAIAQDQQVKLLYGEVLTQNQPMLDLAKKLGFKVRRAEDPQLCHIEMAL
ncbi:bifunctional acetate--CoA ligase family protein/GNAT family N-acetyltransferase [Desulfobacca acetoxidans]